MAAASVTGTGSGSSNKFTTNELSILSNGPTIVLTGYVDAIGVPSSPPSSSWNTVIFPSPLAGDHSHYVVLLTTQNGGYAYVNEMNEDAEGNFSDFSFITESDCVVMYLVASVGAKPNL